MTTFLQMMPSVFIIMSMVLRWGISFSTAFSLDYDGHGFASNSKIYLVGKSQKFRASPIYSKRGDKNSSTGLQHHDDGCDNSFHDKKRRDLMATAISSLPAIISITNPTLSNAADFDTSSDMNDLTRQIRTSVVRGAQIIDKLDGKWERFSDDFGLGENRNQPKKKVLGVGGEVEVKAKDVETSVLDEAFALRALEACDSAFLQCMQTVTKENLMQQIDQTKELVRKSFVQNSPTSSGGSLTIQEEFNFECYTHFRVFNDILVKQKVFFPTFQKEFEVVLGKRLVQLAKSQDPSLLPQTPSSLNDKVQTALQITDNIAALLQKNGLVSSWERSNPSKEDIEDFTSPISSESFYVTSDLQYTLALNGDNTLNSQILLQELGYRLYPAFGRWLLREGLLECFRDVSGAAVNIDDYYFDTAYNSNPDLFEVKQVLLNIVIQRG